MAAGKFGSFVGKMMSKAQKEGTRSGPSEVAEKAKLAEVGRMKKAELEKIASNPESDYYMAAKRELKRREDVRTGTEAKGVRAMGREKAASTKDIREAAERSVEEKRMLGMKKGGSVKKYNKGGMGLEDDNLDSAMDKFRERAKQRQAQGKTTKLSDMPLVDQYEQARRMGRFSGTFKEFLESREKPEEEKRKGGMAGGYAKGGAVKAFKPCPGCPTPAKCKKAGKCMAKMPSKGSKKPTGGMLIIPVRLAKAPAKKGKKG